jgi:hypothetical protein
MKITIKRTFSRTRQIADFVPVRAECEATVEVDCTKEESGNILKNNSAALDQFVQSEVEKTLMGYVPCCVSCGGKPIYPKKDLSKGGECDACVNKQQMEARQFRADNAKNRAAKQGGETVIEYGN